MAWIGAIGGVTLRLIWFDGPVWLIASTYLGLGWVAVLGVPSLLRALGAVTFAFVLLGGLVYSVGAVVFARRRPDPVPTVFGYHELFHALVLLAGACFYVAVARTVS